MGTQLELPMTKTPEELRTYLVAATLAYIDACVYEKGETKQVTTRLALIRALDEVLARVR